MQNKTPGARRQKWLNAYRIGTPILLVAVLVAIVSFGSLLLSRSFAPITATQADKVAQASTFLEDAGFSSPIYQGVKSDVEGQYPTFQVTAIGGKSVNVLIRTTANGGWEIQPEHVFKSVASADDFARVAQLAVSNWKNIPDSIKPRTDGGFGEYESRKANYDLLKDYAPGEAYWSSARNETDNWPRK